MNRQQPLTVHSVRLSLNRPLFGGQFTEFTPPLKCSKSQNGKFSQLVAIFDARWCCAPLRCRFRRRRLSFVRLSTTLSLHHPTNQRTHRPLLRCALLPATAPKAVRDSLKLLPQPPSLSAGPAVVPRKKHVTQTVVAVADVAAGWRVARAHNALVLLVSQRAHSRTHTDARQMRDRCARARACEATQHNAGSCARSFHNGNVRKCGGRWLARPPHGTTPHHTVAFARARNNGAGSGVALPRASAEHATRIRGHGGRG